MSHSSFRIIAPLVIVGAVAALPANAKDKEGTTRPAQIEELYACRNIADATTRLACFDREVSELASADDARDIMFTDRETAKATRRGLFGFSLPKLSGIFGDDGDIKEIETVIQSARMDRSGKYMFVMEDGAVWRQVEVTTLARDPRPGDKATIKVAAMGSYFVKVEGGRALRMIRER